MVTVSPRHVTDQAPGPVDLGPREGSTDQFTARGRIVTPTSRFLLDLQVRRGRWETAGFGKAP
jgi:hypothetical protein